ncbi:MAG: MBL fold metallo-hydrolase [Oscillospiraceae bacterium]|nr:MBL fold metallo-hydrolase [Oscillospiraceae bacterium]
MAVFTTLYSGSSGNCAYIKEGDGFLLVDMGKNCKQTMLGLAALQEDVKNLQGILITHEHSDHISGLKVFLKKVKVPIYGSSATLDFLAERELVPADIEMIPLDGGRPENIGEYTVNSFRTSHDSADCAGYRIVTPSGKIAAIATDLGYVSDEVYENLKGADVIGLESNYDEQMLMFGAYPYYLKKRIASTRGHLCNVDSANTISRLIQDGSKRFALCHLSQENNTPGQVRLTLEQILQQAGIELTNDMIMQVASRHAVSPIIEF